MVLVLIGGVAIATAEATQTVRRRNFGMSLPPSRRLSCCEVSLSMTAYGLRYLLSTPFPHLRCVFTIVAASSSGAVG